MAAKKRMFFSGLGLMCFLFLSHAQAEAPLQIKLDVTKFTLANGLTVLLHEDHSVPMISYHTWYRVGSRDEKPGITGSAHMLEHMMFKGAKKYSNKDFDRILHENGISNNAFTSWDYTGFYENLPSHKLELIMDVELDRMRDLALNAADLEKELEVVKEERRWRVDNNPTSLLRERLFSELYTVHPYSWPIIGTLTDIANYKIAPLKDFYQRFYVPNNAVLVIAGDFNLPKTRAMIEKYYGDLKRVDVPPRTYSLEPELKKEKRFDIEAEVQNTNLVVAFKGVASGHPDSYALDLLAAVLGNGDSSRLHRRMVYQAQLAAGVSCYNLTNADPGAVMFGASLLPKKSSTQVEKIILSEIEQVRKNLVTVDELEKVKNQIMKDMVDELSTIDGKAKALAVNEILFGDHLRLLSDLERYREVKVADLQRVANIYLQDSRRVTGLLNPKKKIKSEVKK